MEIRFQNKDESNRQQREDFLKLSPSERFWAFLELSRRVMAFPTRNKKENEPSPENFVLRKRSER